MGVVEFGQHVAGDRTLPAQGLDLELERAILEFLRGFHETVDVPENRLQGSVTESRRDSVRISRAGVPVVAALEPPRLPAVRFHKIGRMRQAPYPEFRTDEGLVAVFLRVAVRRPRKRGAIRKGFRGGGEGGVLVWKAVVPVKVLDVGLQMIVARKAGRVVDDEAIRDETLGLVEKAYEPASIVRIVVQLDPPALVKEGPDANRGMKAKVVDRSAKDAPDGFASLRREKTHVGHVEPHNQAQPVREIEIFAIGDLHVASQRVESHRLCVPEALLDA